MKPISLILIIIFLIALMIIIPRIHRRKIQIKVESFGGSLINIEKILFSRGPFMMRGKGIVIYRFDYILDNRQYEGWVKFGSLLGPDWRI